MKHLFIINPAAGSRDRSRAIVAAIDEACQGKKLDYQVKVSTKPGDCCRLAQEAAQTGEEIRIYACGGDGTLNEVCAGAAGYDNAAITVFSGGSGNDFVKLFNDPAAFYDLERLLDADEATFDLIDCNGEISMNICSVGLDARIAADMAKFKRLPMLHGQRAYLAATAVNLFKGISEHSVVEIEGETFDGDHTFICVCNGRFYGGGFNPIPEAHPADGMMDVLIVDKVYLPQVPFLIGKYKSGHYEELGKLVRHYKTTSLTVHCDKPSAINLDGEIRFAQDITFKLSDKKIRFFYPKGLTWQKKVAEKV